MASEQFIFYHTQWDRSYKGTRKQMDDAIRRTWPGCDIHEEEGENITARDSHDNCLIELYVTSIDAPPIPERFNDEGN